MVWYVWLSVAAIVASLIASGVTIWAHLRINRIQRSQRLSTSGGHSPITTMDNAGHQITINTGGGSVKVYPGSSSSP